MHAGVPLLTGGTNGVPSALVLGIVVDPSEEEGDGVVVDPSEEEGDGVVVDPSCIGLFDDEELMFLYVAVGSFPLPGAPGAGWPSV